MAKRGRPKGSKNKKSKNKKRGRPKGSKNKKKGLITKITIREKMPEKEGVYTSPEESSFKSKREIDLEEFQKARINIAEGSLPTNIGFDEFTEYLISMAKFQEKVEGEKRHVEIEVPAEKPIAIAFLSDVHAGSAYTDYALLEKTAQLIKEHPLAYCITGGDITDSLFFSYGDEILNMQAQYVFMQKLLREKIGAENILAGIVGNHECMDEQTEAYTKGGWKKWSELKKSDYFLTINKGGQCEWKKADKIIIEEYEGELNRFTGRHIDMLVTDNHKIALIDRRNRKIERIEASKVIEKRPFDYKEFVMAGGNTNKDYKIEDSWIKLIAWIMTDGWIGKNNCGISQRKEKAHLPRQVLDDCGASYSENERTRKNVTILEKVVKHIKPSIDFCIHAQSREEIRKLLDNGKYSLPSWVYKLSKRQFDVFLNSLIDGDGSRKGIKAECFYQKNKVLIDELQAVCAMNGYRTSIYPYGDNQYRLNICERNSVREISTKIEREEYKGVIWDITVPNHIFLVRRNGYAYFTGNSWASKIGVTNYIEFTNSLQRPLLYGVSFIDLKVGEITYKILASHQFKGSSYINPTHQEGRANREMPGADIVMAAHTHKPGESIIYPEKYGGAKSKVVLVNGKTFQKASSYGKNKGFVPIPQSALGCNWLILNHDRKMMRVMSNNEEMIETMSAYL